MSSITRKSIMVLRAVQRRHLHENEADAINARVLKIEAESNGEWDDKAIAELNAQEGLEVKLDGVISGYDGIRVSDGNIEFMLFKDSDEAERFAIAQVKNDLDSDPSMFSQDWLDEFLTISDTDRRIMAQEQADFYVDDLDDDRVLEEVDKKDERDELQERLDDLDSKMESYDEELEELQDELDGNPDRERMNEIKERISEINHERNVDDAERKKLNKELEVIVDEARETLKERIFNQWEEGLKNPISFLVDDQGLYTREDLLKANFISIDTDEAAKDAVRVDGVAHFLATYDGDETELPSGAVAYRTN